MARGAQGKQKRKAERKEAREKPADEEPGRHFFEEPFATEENGEKEDVNEKDVKEEEEEDEEEEEEEEEGCCGPAKQKEDIMTRALKPNKKEKQKKSSSAASCGPKTGGGGGGIKPLPLILLIMLTGTTVLPAIFFMGDRAKVFFQKNNVMGSVGYHMGIGASPRKRIISFYEKHEPEKVSDVPKILSKYYGDYPTMIKRLERKYNDYGYFLRWEEDEAPSKLAKENLIKTYESITTYIDLKFQSVAPRWLKNRVRNVKTNLRKLWRQGRKMWKKTLWPMLEPIFGVPSGGEAQKRKDRRQAEKKSHKKYAYRDEEEF